MDVLKNFKFSTMPVLVIIYWSLIFSTYANAKCNYGNTNGFFDCRNQSLSTVPNDMGPFTKIIDLSLNKIHHIDHNSFNVTIFVTEIYLAANNLSSIGYNTFSHLEHLQLLDLSQNHLTAFQVETPISLEILYLDYNPLTNQHIFQQRIQFLKYVSLAGTNFTTPPAGLFSPFLPVLEYLDLQDNPSLAITVDDLAKLKHLRVLYLSPRIFVARSKIKKCKEFVNKARELKIEVKAFACYPEDSFETRGRFFERTYQVDEAMNDHPENVLIFPVANHNEKNDTCLHDLQKLVSNGMANFIRSLLIERLESRPYNFKIRDPIHLEDYSIAVPRSKLFDVHMFGFPLFNTKKEPEISFSSSDAEYLKHFQAEFKTTDTNRDIVISGRFEIERKYGNFTCKFTDTSYQSKRAMLRRYDFRIWPTNIQERVNFEKMDCSTSMSNQYTSNVIEMVLLAMSQNWLDSVSNIGSIVTLQPALKRPCQIFAGHYRDRVLEEVIKESIHYLEKININSFDVTPTLNLEENGYETSIPEMTYNIQINNLFKYEKREIKYKTVNANSSMKVYVETVIHYKENESAKLAITSKSDLSEKMELYIGKIDINLELEVKLVNKVHKLDIKDVKVNVLEKQTRQQALFIISFVKKYLDMELAKEFKRSLTFLTDKVDFYSLNVA